MISLAISWNDIIRRRYEIGQRKTVFTFEYGDYNRIQKSHWKNMYLPVASTMFNTPIKKLYMGEKKRYIV
jgi:hypothetical protein